MPQQELKRLRNINNDGKKKKRRKMAAYRIYSINRPGRLFEVGAY